MSSEKGFGQGDPRLARYTDQIFAPEDDVLREIRTRTEAEGLPTIQVSRFDALHLELLARAAGARRAVEIGTLAGYSAVALLRGMPDDGVLHTFERGEHHADIARETFRRYGFESRVRLHLGDALEELPTIEREGPFDLVFIDADKERYPDYLAWAEDNLRIGGLVIGDNAFGWGQVLEPEQKRSAGIRGIDQFNRRLAQGGRFRATMLPTEDGLAVGVKIR